MKLKIDVKTGFISAQRKEDGLILGYTEDIIRSGFGDDTESWIEFDPEGYFVKEAEIFLEAKSKIESPAFSAEDERELFNKMPNILAKEIFDKSDLELPTNLENNSDLSKLPPWGDKVKEFNPLYVKASKDFPLPEKIKNPKKGLKK